MTVGNQLSSANVDAQITNLSVSARDIMQAIANLSVNVNGQGTGLVTLEASGYSAPDAGTALAAISFLNTVSGVWFGTAAQPTEFSFNNELSQYGGGR